MYEITRQFHKVPQCFAITSSGTILGTCSDTAVTLRREIGKRPAIYMYIAGRLPLCHTHVTRSVQIYACMHMHNLIGSSWQSNA